MSVSTILTKKSHTNKYISVKIQKIVAHDPGLPKNTTTHQQHKIFGGFFS